MSDRKQKQELRRLLINCFKEAVKYISEHEENLTENQAFAIDSIEAEDDDFDTVLDNMVEEAEMGDQVQEATEFYEEFLNVVQKANRSKSEDPEAETRSKIMLNEYRLSF